MSEKNIDELKVLLTVGDCLLTQLIGIYEFREETAKACVNPGDGHPGCCSIEYFVLDR